MEETTTYSLRIPNELRDAVRQAAQEDQRSLHGQMLWLVRLGLQARSSTAIVFPHAGNGHLRSQPDQLPCASHPVDAD